jgi:hypothetical protein
LLLAAFLLLLPITACADDLDKLERLPFRERPVDYFGVEAEDAGSRLARRVALGEVKLERREGTGWLLSLLRELRVPVESQVLVFSKSSVHARLIGPKTPRAIYFNDEVYVGWVPGSPMIEVSAIDPAKGAIFHAVNQDAGDGRPSFVREESCLLCHASAGSLNVPGHLLRSFVTDRQGEMRSGWTRVTHDTPFANRWGGWFATALQADGFGSLANLVGDDDHARHRTEPGFRGPVTDLTEAQGVDLSAYPSKHSDVVALLVLDHQVHGHNLLTRVSYEARFDRRSEAEELLLRYLLFADEAPLPAPIRGSSGFVAWFEKQGPRDRQGRSLRQLDLNTRLLRFRCSPLIYGAAFDGLPEDVRQRLFNRLREVLTAREPVPQFARLSAAERRAIFEIIRETKAALPPEWRPDTN